jgi:hypothetical protein
MASGAWVMVGFASGSTAAILNCANFVATGFLGAMAAAGAKMCKGFFMPT